MASEPYCATAPSRRISSDEMAIDGIEARSGPCEPKANAVSPPWKTCTRADRLKRLPLSMTSIWSPGRPRRDGARTKLDASEMEFWPTMNDGTTLDRASSMFPEAGFARSAPVSTSIGAADSVTVRSVRRVPVTMTSVSAFGRADSLPVEVVVLSCAVAIPPIANATAAATRDTGRD